ncbi:MAG: CHAT domain-containing protein, partial [Chloroflexaceae bacterium]|nr:CHAT domain-containing protein [Chloroflexaceae bacterium]
MSLQTTIVMDDIEVQVLDPDEHDPRYRVYVQRADGNAYRGRLNLDGMPAPPAGSSATIASYGLELFYRLFAPPLDDAFQQALAAADARQRGLRLRLWINSVDTTLHEIPWELMHYSASSNEVRPLATDSRIAFSRYLDSTEPWVEPLEYRPLRVLLAIAAPADLGTAAWPDLVAIDKQNELRELEAHLSTLRNAGHLHLHPLVVVSPETLINALQQPYDALIYYGHALHHRQRGTRLVLEDHDTGNATLFESDRLVQCLRDAAERPRLVILIACNTAAQQVFPRPSNSVDLHAPTSLAARLVQRSHIPAVLAMQRLLDISVARVFSAHLSEYLLRHGFVDVAVNAARRHVFSPTSIEWSTPVLYMRSPDGRLFAPNARLEYIQSIVSNPEFARWQTPEFIQVEAIVIPPGQPWHLFLQRPTDAPPGSDALETLRRELRLGEATPPTNLIALLGPPRSGQTTILQRFTYEQALLAREQATHEAMVAVFVPLSGYDQQRGSNRLEQMILDTVGSRVPALRRELQNQFQQSLLNQPTPDRRTIQRCIFILDGLDSVPEDDRAEAATDIVALARRMPNQRFIVSSTQDVFPARIFHHATVVLSQPLSERLVLRYFRQRNAERSGQLYRILLENRLLDLTTDPAMLVFVFEQLVYKDRAIVSRNQLLQDLLEQSLSRLPDRYLQGDAARRTLTRLAWEFRWRGTDAMLLNDVFAIMAEVRRERDYSLETLFQFFLSYRLLVEVGYHQVRFVYPALQAYCAALELRSRPDFHERLNDIIALCGISQRLTWWEETMYALAGALDDPVPLAPLIRAAILDQTSNHTLLVARCLRVLSDTAEQRLSDAARLAYIDICVARLHIEREPSEERRALIATAMGRLQHPKVFEELNLVLTHKAEQASGELRYDHPRVRLAAARALRVLLARFPESTLYKHTTMAGINWTAYRPQDIPAPEDLV